MRTSSTTPARLRQVLAAALAALGTVAALVLQAGPATAAPATRTPGAAVEAFAPYQGQSTCDPVARAGTTAFRDAVLKTYPGTGDFGIVRSCSVGGTSEHKEGRAWDWRVSASNPTQLAQAEDMLAWLTAPDEYGNTAAMARRLGVMYMIYNSKVWKSYQASKGWQPYVGPSPHTDHVHFSLSWAGAYGATSYWSGSVAPVMYAPAQPPPPATATATIGTSAPPTVVSRLQRRLVKGSLPGPWRRH